MKLRNQHQFPLFGDYELLIDQCLGGNKELKRLVAQKDRINRGGLQVLKKALTNHQAKLNSYHLDILQRCEQDQELWETQQEDLESIRIRKNGKYQARVVVEHNRYSAQFESLREAQVWRDRMACFACDIAISELAPSGSSRLMEST